MKKVLCIFLCSACLLSACSADISSPANTEVDREQLEQYLSENMGKEYVEPGSFCSEVTEGTIFFEDGTLSA
ncbi:hypothetical protein [Anaerotruncus rubiinfantis]|uniref:hypothetical protein n=1 Tax=Anaerotruncus rubiinfantis TaxID=1720200 RepID=UPI003D7BBA1F